MQTSQFNELASRISIVSNEVAKLQERITALEVKDTERIARMKTIMKGE